MTMIVIAGRPSSGKTLWAVQHARKAMLEKRAVVFFELEVSEEFLRQRYGLPESARVLDRSDPSTHDIAVLIERYRPDVCIVDYVQLLSDWNEDCLFRLQEHAARYNVELVATSQVRASVSHERRLPRPEDLHRVRLPSDVTFLALARDTCAAPGCACVERSRGERVGV